MNADERQRLHETWRREVARYTDSFVWRAFWSVVYVVAFFGLAAIVVKYLQ